MRDGNSAAVFIILVFFVFLILFVLLVFFILFSAIGGIGAVGMVIVIILVVGGAFVVDFRCACTCLLAAGAVSKNVAVARTIENPVEQNGTSPLEKA